MYLNDHTIFNRVFAILFCFFNNKDTREYMETFFYLSLQSLAYC